MSLLQNGRKVRVGLPDFRNGVEIKTPMTSRNALGAMDNYLENAAKKDGVKRVVIDNTASLFTDKELIDAARKALADYPKIPLLTILKKDGMLLNI